jgi:hypothetical protein
MHVVCKRPQWIIFSLHFDVVHQLSTPSTFEKGEGIGFWTLMDCDFGRCLMLEMEICQIRVGKPPLQCYGFP